MRLYKLFAGALSAAVAGAALAAFTPSHPPILAVATLDHQAPTDMQPEMPTVRVPGMDNRLVAGGRPEEQRGEAVRRYLKVSFRIRNGNIFGSGTMCYYDPKTKTAYVISCAHLFRGREKTCEIHAFYKNGEKLPKYQTYQAEVICFHPRQDISFLKFQPDWEPDEYFRIAPTDFPLPKGEQQISAGCDGGREVAAYDVEIVGINRSRSRMGQNLDDLITVQNSPRHGRSGGGLLTESGWYVGICWGSEDPINGTMAGLFVPLTRIHAYAKSQNLGWLLSVPPSTSQIAGRKYPIVDINGPQGVYPKDYIPIP